MSILIGSLSARPLRFSEQQDAVSGDGYRDLIEQINQRVRPPAPVTPDDVHIRALRLVSDDVNDHGGRFPREEHDRLSALLIDTPVLVGHDRTRLPVARNFAARCVSEGDRQWIEVWFYWLRGDGPFQDQLAGDIDAGVVKEGSIGFEFRRPQCSICGRDIRTCEHIPDQEYIGDDGTLRTAHYEYRDIVRVLETSLVYRGATPGTHFARPPLFGKPHVESPALSGPAGAVGDAIMARSLYLYSTGGRPQQAFRLPLRVSLHARCRRSPFARRRRAIGLALRAIYGNGTSPWGRSTS
ncbi:MAG: hypothetical protein AB1792_11105 [Candidatus Zixiibacteriota bacterium]